MGARTSLVVGEQGLDLSTIMDRDGVAPVFTPDQEARIRQIVREEIDADRAKGIGAVADAASEVIRRQSRRAR